LQPDTIIRTNALTKRFRTIRREVIAVDNLSIEVPRGSIYGFLGPNGSCKTTTIGMLLGLIRPSSGTIELFGIEAAKRLPELLTRTSSVLENSPMYPYLSGRDNLEVFARMKGVKSKQRIDEVLDQVGLSNKANNQARTYSLGMRQRLSIAMALLNDPELIVLDEPTNGLDPSGIIEIRQLISQLGQQGKTIFLSSHLLHEVEQVCNHVAVLNRGKVIAQGSVNQLISKGKTLQLKVSELPGATSLLANIEWITSIETDHDYVYVGAEEEKYADINDLLVKGGIRVFEMNCFKLRVLTISRIMIRRLK